MARSRSVLLLFGLLSFFLVFRSSSDATMCSLASPTMLMAVSGSAPTLDRNGSGIFSLVMIEADSWVWSSLRAPPAADKASKLIVRRLVAGWWWVEEDEELWRREISGAKKAPFHVSGGSSLVAFIPGHEMGSYIVLRPLGGAPGVHNGEVLRCERGLFGKDCR